LINRGKTDDNSTIIVNTGCTTRRKMQGRLLSLAHPEQWKFVCLLKS